MITDQTNLCMLLAAAVWAVILFQIFTSTNFTPNGRLVKTSLVRGATGCLALDNLIHNLVYF